jgi:hypothetical protein
MTSFRNDQGTGSVEADVATITALTATAATLGGASTIGGIGPSVLKKVTVTIVDGAAAGTFTLPTGSVVEHYYIDTPTTIPGTPTNTNLRLGSAANGEQYVADVDVKTQGWINATVVYAGRKPATTVHYTVASSGGTAASQDGSVVLYVAYAVPV